MKPSILRVPRTKRVFGLLLLGVVMGVVPPAWPQPEGYREWILEDDFKLPLKDLEELSGEIVWIHGAALRGDPRPYRNPVGPVAAYEQGLLDEEGDLWTFLDTPSGRELRYNPELRGQRLVLRGWLYPKSKIMEVHAWEDNSKHPVRNREDYPEPEKIPFDPTRANQIESIRPVAPSQISPDLLNLGIWEIQEGKKIDTTIQGATEPATLSPEAEQLNRLLEEAVPPGEPTSDAYLDSKSLLSPPPQTAPRVLEESFPSALPRILPPRDQPRQESSGLPIPQARILNQEGEPLASPKEFDEALQKALLK